MRITEALGFDTDYAYGLDANSRNGYLTKTTLAMDTGTGDDVTTSYAYDANGNVTKITDALGHDTDMTVNARNLETQRVGCSCGPKVKMTYDKNDRLVTKETLYATSGGDTFRTTLYQYDVMGNLTKEIEKAFDGTNDLSTVYAYDASDQLTCWV